MHNPFIYRERENIVAFFEESELWQEIYEVFVRVKDNSYKLKIPPIKVFNEVRYQCIRIMLDDNPEEQIWENYLNDARDNLGTRYTSDLCFTMVYVVLVLINNPAPKIKIFIMHLKERVRCLSYYYTEFEKLINRKLESGIRYDLNFDPEPEMPCNLAINGSWFTNNYIGLKPISDIDYAKWWYDVTNNFDQQQIISILNSWSRPEDKIEVLNLIEHVFDEVTSKNAVKQFEEADLPF